MLRYRRLSAALVVGLLFGAFMPYLDVASAEAAVVPPSALSVALTANASWNRSFGWRIEASSSPGSVSPTSTPINVTDTVTVTKYSERDQLTISGTLCVLNGGAISTEGLSVSIEATPAGATGPAIYNRLDVRNTPSIAATKTVCYPFTVTSVATYSAGPVSVTGRANSMARVGYGVVRTESVPATIAAAPGITLVNDAVTMTMPDRATWSLAASGTRAFVRPVSCRVDVGRHSVTYVVNELPKRSAQTSYSVNCPLPTPTPTTTPRP